MTYGDSRKLIVESILLFAVIVLPFSVHAGIFDVFFDTAKADTGNEAIALVPSDNMQLMPILKAALHIDPNPAKGGGDILIEDGALVPHGDIDGQDAQVNTRTMNGEISLYIVREGDTLSQIATMFDVSAKTVLWANDITDPSKIRPGDTLVILPITGVRHIVKQGDTIKSIAQKYNGNIEDILSYNQLASADGLSVGDTVVIPDGTISTPSPVRSGTGKGTKITGGSGTAGFINPLPGAVRSQGIHGYNGVDLAGVPVGTPVIASAAGEVIVAKSSGWNGGYGTYVVIKHANGAQTLYAHLSSVSVSAGQSVKQGQKIGGMGNTGRSTGPHLHFEVRGARNPF